MPGKRRKLNKGVPLDLSQIGFTSSNNNRSRRENNQEPHGFTLLEDSPLYPIIQILRFKEDPLEKGRKIFEPLVFNEVPQFFILHVKRLYMLEKSVTERAINGVQLPSFKFAEAFIKWVAKRKNIENPENGSQLQYMEIDTIKEIIQLFLHMNISQETEPTKIFDISVKSFEKASFLPHSLLDWFVEEIYNHKLEKNSFGALLFLVKNQLCHKHLTDPQIILYILTNPDLHSIEKYTTKFAHYIENFAEHHEKSFRDEICQILIQAEKLPHNLYSEFLERLQIRTSMDYNKFHRNIVEIMNTLLKREIKPTNDIVIPWSKYITGKLIPEEIRNYFDHQNLHLLDDLFHTVIVQNPYSQNVILKLLDRQSDKFPADFYEKWKIFNPYGQKRNFIQDLVTAGSVNGKENLFKLPEHIVVEVVDHPNGLQKILEKLHSQKDGSFLGLDNEGISLIPGNRQNRVVLCQIAFEDSIYLIRMDEDGSINKDELKNFFNNFFENETVIKLAFGADGDLDFLQRLLPTCDGVYEPKKVACLQNILKNLETKTFEKYAIPSDDDKLKCDTMINKIWNPLRKNDTTENNINPDEYTGKKSGLKDYCSYIFGLSLDKSEQRSVWDRRPFLRASQISYAALDAYVLRELYKKCEKWAKILEIDFTDCICYEPAKKSRPLFCEYI